MEICFCFLQESPESVRQETLHSFKKRNVYTVPIAEVVHCSRNIHNADHSNILLDSHVAPYLYMYFALKGPDGGKERGGRPKFSISNPRPSLTHCSHVKY